MGAAPAFWIKMNAKLLLHTCADACLRCEKDLQAAACLAPAQLHGQVTPQNRC
jgi:hypothetical protein